jgi:hypothetical protein
MQNRVPKANAPVGSGTQSVPAPVLAARCEVGALVEWAREVNPTPKSTNATSSSR